MKKIFYQLMAVAIAACTFTACEDVPEPYNNPLDNQKETEPAVEVEPAGSGTQADPWNVTALQKACEGLAAGSFLNDGAEVYVKGVVVDATDVSVQYGNATYYIADDINGAIRFYVYRGKLLDGAAVTAETDLQVGDTVVVCGKVKNYAGKDGDVLEFDQGNKLVYFAKGKGGSSSSTQPATEATIGSATEPITVAKALELINAMEDNGESKEIAFVKGKVVSVQSFNDQYKSITYYISDDGTENGQIQCYSGKNVGGADFTSKDDIKVGQEVIVKGKLKKYVNKNTGAVTPELNQGNELVNASGSTTPDTPTTDAKKVTIAEFNAAAVSNDVWYTLTGTVKNLKADDIYGNFDLEDETGTVYVYGLLAEKGGEKKKFKELVEAKGITEGCTITIIGTRGEYNGKIEVMNAYFVSIGGSSEPTPDPEPTYPEGTQKVTIAAFNAAAVSTDVWYVLTGTVKNLKADDIYGNFDLEDETGTVYVYGLLAEKGGEKKKFKELVAAKGITEGCTITIIGTRGEYNGKIEVMNAYFYSIEGSSTVTPDPEPTPSTGATKATVAEFNAAAVSTDVWYELTGTVKNLKADDIYGNFDLEDATGSVYVYGLLAEKGGEKKKFKELVTAKGITEGCTITIVGTRGDYNGKIEVLNAYFISIAK